MRMGTGSGRRGWGASHGGEDGACLEVAEVDARGRDEQQLGRERGTHPSRTMRRMPVPRPLSGNPECCDVNPNPENRHGRVHQISQDALAAGRGSAEGRRRVSDLRSRSRLGGSRGTRAAPTAATTAAAPPETPCSKARTRPLKPDIPYQRHSGHPKPRKSHGNGRPDKPDGAIAWAI